MSDTPGAGRLDPETLAAYIDGLLPDDEREKVEAEIAAAPESYEWVVSAMSAVDDASVVTPAGDLARPAPRPAPVTEPDPVPKSTPAPPEKKVLPFYRRRTVQGLGALLLASAAALALMVQPSPRFYRAFMGDDTDPLIAQLVEAVGEERYIEARLTGGFRYGPLRQIPRGGSGGSSNLALLSAARTLKESALKEPSPRNLHASAVGQILASRSDASESIRMLEQAAARRSTARLLSDLGAAYLERWRTIGAPSDLDAALRVTTSALEQSPILHEAHFNRALILEAQGKVDEAILEWRSYLARSSEGDWTLEARRHLARLTHSRSLEPLRPHPQP